ncbi:MAG: SDR family oxidoreductase [Endozoicomonas sp. (ex Botrylloides leachii)]|nr:SDR family oxidoreductase [Endozoicomonas sp. (ex Botrylloides leachii)]
MKKKQVFIAGCGYVGCELARQLMSRGDVDVWGLRRNTKALPAGVHPIQGDLAIAKTFDSWPVSIDYVIYCLAAKDHTEASYRQAYLQCLDNLICLLEKENQQPKRILFTSSTGVYHQSGGVWVNESSTTEPKNYAGQIMLEAENLLKQAPFPSTAIRFGGIYGPDRIRLLNRAKEGVGCYAEPPVYGNRIHRDDCAGILAHLLMISAAELPIQPVYLGVDNDPAPIYDVLQWLANKEGTTLNNDNPPPARGNKRCDNALIRSTGYRFHYPDYRSGYANGC